MSNLRNLLNYKALRKLIFCFLLSMPLFCTAKTGPVAFQIQGISGNLLVNVQQRLMELQNSRTLSTLPKEELQTYIEKAMYPYGFFKPEIQISAVNSGPLNITIQKGPALRISELSLTVQGAGKKNPAILETLQDFPLKPGDVLESLPYEAAKQSLMTIALQQGYQRAFFEKAEMLIDKEGYQAKIKLIFNTGDQYFFGQVQFDPSYISPQLLQRYLPFQQGQPYSEKEISVFNDALLNSGYFKSVSIKTLDPENQAIPLNVHLEPTARINYSLGLGYGTDTGARGQAGIHVVPVNSLGHKFNAVALGSFRENTLKSQYVVPGHNPLVDQYEITGSVSNLDYESGHSSSSLLSLGQRHVLPKFERVLSLNNLYERFRYNETSTENNRSFFPEATLTWLKKSDPLFSPQGHVISVDSFLANKRLFSSTNFAQISLDAKAAWTLEAIKTRFYLHGSLGFTQIENINKLPLSLALLLGGSDNLKGFDYNSIGPGKVLQYGGLEIQKEIKPKWYLTTFADIGTVYDPAPYDLQKDIGLGLMWVSPVGPIKIGLAVPLEDHFHLNFSKHPQLVIKMGPDL